MNLFNLFRLNKYSLGLSGITFFFILRNLLYYASSIIKKQRYVLFFILGRCAIATSSNEQNDSVILSDSCGSATSGRLG